MHEYVEDLYTSGFCVDSSPRRAESPAQQATTVSHDEYMTKPPGPGGCPRGPAPGGVAATAVRPCGARSVAQHASAEGSTSGGGLQMPLRLGCGCMADQWAACVDEATGHVNPVDHANRIPTGHRSRHTMDQSMHLRLVFAPLRPGREGWAAGRRGTAAGRQCSRVAGGSAAGAEPAHKPGPSTFRGCSQRA